MTEAHPTCDRCGAPGFARYKHATADRWIDVCAQCAPTGTRTLRYYHTERHTHYPATTAAEVHNPRSFIRS